MTTTSLAGEQRAAHDVAIIGMACLFPGAPSLEAYWQNIINKVSSITDPPSDAWPAEMFYDPSSRENDRLYCKKGGFIAPHAIFNPLKHGIMPKTAAGGEPDQWLALDVARQALEDAGYGKDVPNGERAAVIFGKGNYLNRGMFTMLEHGVIIDQILRLMRQLHPELPETAVQAMRSDLKSQLPPFAAETMSGHVPNAIAGRVANKLDLMGPSYTVDAACASSLVAVEQAIKGLRSGAFDLALVGGVQITTPVPIWDLFAQLNALSLGEEIRPFDRGADGTLLSEGIGMMVLKRLGDAEADGDRIYAVMKGAGVSSDGRAVSVMAPRLEGEELALRRAYEDAQIDPLTVGLIEAHGTATVVGDATEIQALTNLFGEHGRPHPFCALGSVKSNIGHTMPAAGMAGLIKSALALYHRVLPPTLNVEAPNPALLEDGIPFYLNTETRPWIHGGKTPRRAGINAFGFGGINGHVVLEEYPPRTEAELPHHQHRWPSEVVVLRASSRAALLEEAAQLATFLENVSVEVPLKDIAYSCNMLRADLSGGEGQRLAIVASSSDDLQTKLATAQDKLADPKRDKIKAREGIYYWDEPLGREGKVAFVFPGEGAQYPNMLRQLATTFPPVRAPFDEMAQLFGTHPRGFSASDLFFPRARFSDEEQQQTERQIWQMDVAIEALITANHAIYKLLDNLGIRPDAMVGHSTGEYAALRAAKMLDVADGRFAERVLQLNRLYEEAASEGEIPRASLIAVGAARERVEAVAATLEITWYVAMDNCPHQTVLACNTADSETLTQHLKEAGLIYEVLPFDRAYHTPLFAPYAEALRDILYAWIVNAPQLPLYSCTTTETFPPELDRIREIAVEHWVAPVEFRQTIQRMYDEGVRIFVEVGPRGNMTAFIDDILRRQHYLAVPANVPHRDDLTQLQHLVAILAASGVPLSLDLLYQQRAPRQVAFDQPNDPLGTATEQIGEMKLMTGWRPMDLSSDTIESVHAHLRAPASTEDASAANREPWQPHGSPTTTVSRPRPTQPHQDTSIQPAAAQSRTEASGGIPAPSSTPVESVFPPIEPPATDDLGAIVGGGNGLATTEIEQVMDAYFETMGRFLQVQQQVMDHYLPPARQFEGDSASVVAGSISPARRGVPALGEHPSHAESPTQEVGGTGAHPFPFEWHLLSLTPGSEMEARCVVSLEESTFLLDHTLGKDVSVFDPTLTALPVMPLTMSMELLAEAAHFLAPDRLLVGMEDIRTVQWIAITPDIQAQGKLILHVTARLDPHTTEVSVGLHTINGEQVANSPVVTARVRFGDGYPEAPAGQPFPPDGSRPSAWHPKEIYSIGVFHGPAFHGIESIDRWGERATEATLRVVPRDLLFATRSGDTLLTDPVLLDQPGQVVAFWLREMLDLSHVIFPFQLEKLELFGPKLPPHERLTCRGRIVAFDDFHMRSNFDLVRENGQLWARLTGWGNRRFRFPKTTSIMFAPRDHLLSDRWDAPLAPLAAPERFRARRLARADLPNNFLKGHGGIWLRVLTHLFLSRTERDDWAALRGTESRRIEWLLGRVAAKDAVLTLLRERHELWLCPADIEIVADTEGQPTVRGALDRALPVPLRVSIAHRNGVAVAIAGEGEALLGLGIDIEPVGAMTPEMEPVAFSPDDLRLLDGLRQEASGAWPVRLWCAKEAAAKAIGLGMIDGPRFLDVEAADPALGRVTVTARGALAHQLPEAAPSIRCDTGVDGALVWSVAVRQ